MNNNLLREPEQIPEIWILIIGYLLAGVVIAISAVSFGLYSMLPGMYVILALFVACIVLAVLLLEWPRGFILPAGPRPRGGLRAFLMIAMPLGFIINSQVCGPGLKACHPSCLLANYALIVLTIGVVILLALNRSAATLIAGMVIICAIPHCICATPVNALWHEWFNGFSPYCEIKPLAITLLSVTALRGVRIAGSTVLVLVLLIVLALMAVGVNYYDFPWPACCA